MIDPWETPFESGEEAFFWFSNSMHARRDGAKQSRTPIYKRPCQADDIYLIIQRLNKQGKIRNEHLRVLNHCAKSDMPPHDGHPEVVRLWKESMKFIEEELLQKNLMSKGLLNA